MANIVHGSNYCWTTAIEFERRRRSSIVDGCSEPFIEVSGSYLMLDHELHPSWESKPRDRNTLRNFGARRCGARDKYILLRAPPGLSSLGGGGGQGGPMAHGGRGRIPPFSFHNGPTTNSKLIAAHSKHRRLAIENHAAETACPIEMQRPGYLC